MASIWSNHEISEFKLVLLGTSGVGKTSLIERLTKNTFGGTQLTCGLSFLKHVVSVNGKTVRLNSK